MSSSHHFFDTATITMAAGHGGPGSVSFRREKFVPKGGPDGGNGGDGASVIFVANHNLRSLQDFRYKTKYKAPDGTPGSGRQCYGKKGEDLLLKVPCGTLIKDPVSGEIIVDFVEDGQTWYAVRGGKGGMGNMHFATSTHQTPYYAQPGLPGEERQVSLELKLLADVGLIGFPNVGKSTIISKITAARPKIANYPFTTLVPNLGVVNYAPEQSFVVADIPGIIKGAHEGIGLGHEFLRHVERTRFLLHVLDVSGIEGRDPIDDYKVLNKELKLYDPKLAKKKQVIVLNKMDLVYDSEVIETVAAFFTKKKLPVFVVSAATGKGLQPVVDYCAEHLFTI